MYNRYMRKVKTHFAYSIYCNREDYEVIRKLQQEHAVNISGLVKLYLRRKLEKLEEIKKNEEI